MPRHAKATITGERPWPKGSSPEEDGRPPAARRGTVYECGRGHTFTVALAADAEVPRHWEHSCGSPAGLRDAAGGVPALDLPGPVFPGYIHSSDRAPNPQETGRWAQLLKRRTIPELEAVLAERMAGLAAARGEGGGQ